MTVKERIAGYYPGKQVKISRIADQELKALVDNHTKLLKAAKRYWTMYDLADPFEKRDQLRTELNTAIEEAEKL